MLVSGSAPQAGAARPASIAGGLQQAGIGCKWPDSVKNGGDGVVMVWFQGRRMQMQVSEEILLLLFMYSRAMGIAGVCVCVWMV